MKVTEGHTILLWHKKCHQDCMLIILLTISIIIIKMFITNIVIQCI